MGCRYDGGPCFFHFGQEFHRVESQFYLNCHVFRMVGRTQGDVSDAPEFVTARSNAQSGFSCQLQLYPSECFGIAG
jgi:hypothetical protein